VHLGNLDPMSMNLEGAEAHEVARLQRLRQLGQDFAAIERPDTSLRSLWEVNSDLYDEHGLPR